MARPEILQQAGGRRPSRGDLRTFGVNEPARYGRRSAIPLCKDRNVRCFRVGQAGEFAFSRPL